MLGPDTFNTIPETFEAWKGPAPPRKGDEAEQLEEASEDVRRKTDARRKAERAARSRWLPWTLLVAAVVVVAVLLVIVARL